MSVLPITQVKAAVSPKVLMVSVIMPVRNEEEFIERSLGAVLNQDYPHEQMEFLIADGLSNDNTLVIVKKMAGAEKIKIIQNHRRIQSAGLNEAIKEATGEIIIRIDAHTIVAPDYVRQCVLALQTSGAHNVGGPMDPCGLTPMGRAIAAAGKSAFAVPSVFHVSQKAQFTDTVYMGAWPKQVLVNVGMFNVNYDINEDYELNYRIRRAGGKIYFSPAIHSQYYGRQKLSELGRQYFRYGKSKIRTLREHPASLRLRQLVAPAFVVFVLSIIPLGAFDSALIKWWLSSLMIYCLLDLYFSTRLGKAWRMIWRMLFVFPTIHLAWGSGFWIGLLVPPKTNRF